MNRVTLLVLALAACAPKPSGPVTEAPAPLPTPAFSLPEVQRFTLNNGVEVMLIEDHELPLFSLEIVAAVGSFTDPDGREGLASAAMGMLAEGTAGKSAVELAQALRALGSELYASAGQDRAAVSLSGLSRNLGPTLELAAEVLTQPRFAPEDWARVQAQRVQDVAAARTNPASMGGRAMARALYGQDWPGRVVTDTSLKAITPDDLRAWHQRHLVPQNAVVVVSGDVDPATLRPLLEQTLGGWASGSPTPTPEVRATPATTTTLTLVDKPGAAQSNIQVSRFVPSRGSADWDALVLANQIWGGGFTSRLNMNLREDKGWTYGARSDLSAGLGPAVWTASTAVRADATVDAVKELLAELGAVAQDRPLTAEELAYHRSSLVLGYPAQFETPDYLLGQQVAVWRYALPADWVSTAIPRLEAVTLEQAQAAFTAHVSTQPLTLVVVGDLAALREPLAALGYPITLADADGRPLTP